MKTRFLATAAALFLFPGSTAEDVSTRYEADLELRVTDRTVTTLSLRSMAVTFDGESMPAEPPEEDTTKTTETVEFVERVLATDAGRRTAVERIFETIAKQEEGPDGDEEATGVLEGRRVTLRMDADEETTAALSDEGPAVDARYLDGFDLVFDPEYLLPDHEVEPGDAWTIEGELARRYFGLDGGVEWFEEDTSEDHDEGPDFEELFGEELSGEVEITFDGPTEHAGEEVWAFSFELSMSGGLEGIDPAALGMAGDEEEDNPFRSGEAEIEADMTGAGRFWVVRESRRLLASEGAGEVDLLLTLSSDLGGHELVAEVEFRVAIEGTTTYAVE